MLLINLKKKNLVILNTKCICFLILQKDILKTFNNIRCQAIKNTKITHVRRKWSSEEEEAEEQQQETPSRWAAGKNG